MTRLLDTPEFVRSLRELRIVPEEKLRLLLGGSDETSLTVERLAGELIAAGALTEYQARMIHRGSGASLVLGNYLVETPIGAGGMGRVYRARHRMMERIVAIKVLHRDSLSDREQLDRFLNEVKVAATLSHPNIVTAFDAAEVRGMPLLVMEYVDGNDLHSVVKTGGPLSLESALAVLLQAARGLDSAHRQGIVHRDVKPGNLLLDHAGTVKLSDLGLARLVSPEQDADPPRDHATRGLVMGSVDYMSPEQVAGSSRVDRRSDIYSLGCTLFFLLTGRTVFPASTPLRTLLAHREQTPPRIDSLRPGLPPEIDELFARMTRKRPEDRFDTLEPVIAELERLRDQRAGSDREQPLRVLVDDSMTTRLLAPPDEGDFQFLEDDRESVAPRRRSRARLGRYWFAALVAASVLVAVLWNLDKFTGAQTDAAVADNPARPGGNRPAPPDVPQPLPPEPEVPPARPDRGAVRFDGRDSEVLVADWLDDVERPLCVEIEVIPHGPTTFGTVVSHFDDLDGWMLGLCRDRWCLTLSQGGIPHQRLLSVAPVRWGEPQRVACVFDERRAALYVDGELQIEWETNSTARGGFRPLRFGRALGTYVNDGYFFDGTLGCVRLSSIDRYAAGESPPAINTLDGHTLGLYEFEEGRGVDARDTSPLTRHGRLRGATWVQ